MDDNDRQDIEKLINFYQFNFPKSKELDELSENLYKRYCYFSSGFAYSICKLIDYYRNK